jgi:hypothetical protein
VRPSVATGAFQVTFNTERSAFPQFPIKRPGASTLPTGADGSEALSEGVADADSVGAADSDAIGVGVGVAESSLFVPVERTSAAKRTIPITTNTTTRLDVPCFGFADGFDEVVSAERLGVGAVVTFTRSREPDVGTGGTTNLDEEVLLRAEDFLTARFAVFFVVFFAVFFAVDFFTARFAVFFADDFFAALFLATDFFTARFTVFFADDFFAALFFLTATLTPWIIRVAYYRRTWMVEV